MLLPPLRDGVIIKGGLIGGLPAYSRKGSSPSLSRIYGQKQVSVRSLVFSSLVRLRGTQMHIISPAASSRCDLTSSSSSGCGGACAVERSAVVKSSPPPKNRLSLRFSQPSLLTRGKKAEEEEDYSLEAKAFETMRSEKGGGGNERMLNSGEMGNGNGITQTAEPPICALEERRKRMISALTTMIPLLLPSTPTPIPFPLEVSCMWSRGGGGNAIGEEELRDSMGAVYLSQSHFRWVFLSVPLNLRKGRP